MCAAIELGPYRLVEVLGEGGMGIVWRAEQREPLRRVVALKLVKPGLDSAQVLARFESERQALALLDHPGIAKVLDAGQTPDGRPYFVMELVGGSPITTYCDERRLSLEERLDLFVQVCEAIQHAHHKGIIHRDIKPSNVLVTTRDDRPAAKVIDFGVAKATGASLTQRTLFTRQGIVVGTPEYMSPEQAGSSVDVIDTRTDIYSLGVLLYELLVGVRPFDASSLGQAALVEILRIIREDEPPRPATRLASLGAAGSDVAERRGVDPSTLARRIRGELEWIAMRALAKEPSRRYASASEFAADVRRYLADEPVLAGPPSAAYRAGKFVRRHRVAVGFATTVGVLLASFSAYVVLQNRRMAAERDRASAQAETARRTAEFLEDLFRVSDPNRSRGSTILAREILERGAERIEHGLADQPLVQSRLMETLGTVYVRLGLMDRARPLLERSLKTREASLGAGDPELAKGLAALGDVEYDQGRFDESEKLYARALGMIESNPRASAALHGRVLANLGNVRMAQGRLDEARELLERSVSTRRELDPPDPAAVAQALTNLGLVLANQGRHDEAQPLLTEAIETFEALYGPEAYDLTFPVHVLANSLGQQGRWADAVPQLQRIVPILESLAGPDHFRTAGAVEDLGTALGHLGRVDEAEPLIRRSIEIKQRALGPDHPRTALGLWSLALLFQENDRPQEALPLYDRALAVIAEAHGAEHPMSLGLRHNLANIHAALGDVAEAERLHREVLDARTRVLGPDHGDVAESYGSLALVLVDLGRTEPAREAALRALEIAERAFGRSTTAFAAALYARACVEVAEGATDTAIATLEEAVVSGLRASRLTADRYLAPLRGDARFEALAK